MKQKKKEREKRISKKDKQSFVNSWLLILNGVEALANGLEVGSEVEVVIPAKHGEVVEDLLLPHFEDVSACHLFQRWPLARTHLALNVLVGFSFPGNFSGDDLPNAAGKKQASKKMSKRSKVNHKGKGLLTRH